MGLQGTNWELGFKQCSLHHIMQVLRDRAFCAFSALPALPPCCCPLAFRHPVRRLTYGTFLRFPSSLWRDKVLVVTAHRVFAQLGAVLGVRTGAVRSQGVGLLAALDAGAAVRVEGDRVRAHQVKRLAYALR